MCSSLPSRRRAITWRASIKRDGGRPVTLGDANLGGVDAGFDALDVDALLTELKQYDGIAADVVSLRVFGGLSIEDAAAALELSVATVKRRWVVGKAWLVRELNRNACADDASNEEPRRTHTRLPRVLPSSSVRAAGRRARTAQCLLFCTAILDTPANDPVLYRL